MCAWIGAYLKALRSVAPSRWNSAKSTLANFFLLIFCAAKAKSSTGAAESAKGRVERGYFEVKDTEEHVAYINIYNFKK